MRLKLEETGGICVVTALPDVLDAGNAARFKTDAARLLEDKKQAAFDMSAVNFIDSAGCGALITIMRRIDESGGVLKLFGVQSQVHSVFELVRIYKIIDIFKTKKEAIRSFKS